MNRSTSLEWLKLEEGFKLRKESSRVGITGFFLDCFAGKDDTEDIEAGGPGPTDEDTNSVPVSFADEPITYAFIASSQAIISAVNSITTSITSLFFKPPQAPIVLDQQHPLFDIVVLDPKTTTTNHEITELITGTVYNSTDVSIIQSESDYPVISTPLPDFETFKQAEIESPRLSRINESYCDDRKTDTKTELDRTETLENYDGCGFWEEPNLEESPSCSANASFYEKEESYIDTSEDQFIVCRPIKKRGDKVTASIRVNFEPILELMDSIVNNDKTTVKKALQSGQFDINVHDKLGYTMLHYAAAHNQIDIMKYLLDKKADVNQLDFGRWSALHLAAIADHYKACKLLVEHGVNVECLNEKGELAVELTEDPKIKKLLSDAVKKKLSSKKVHAVYDWSAESPEDLSITKAQTLRVLEKYDDWWLVQNDTKQTGLVPRIFVQ